MLNEVGVAKMRFLWLFLIVAESHSDAELCDNSHEMPHDKGKILLQASSRSIRQAAPDALELAPDNEIGLGNSAFWKAALQRTKVELLEVGCEANKGIGRDAEISEAGYAQVAETCCQHEMEIYIHRVITNMEMQVCHEAGPTAAAPYHSCQEGPQTLEALKADIQRSIVTSPCGWVQMAALACPPMDYSMCNTMTEEKLLEKTIASSHRRRSCGLNRVGGPITTGFIDLILPDPVTFVQSSEAQRVIAIAIAQAASIPEARVSALAHAAYIHYEARVIKPGVIASFAVVDPHGDLDGIEVAAALKNNDNRIVERLLKENGAANETLVMRMRVYEPSSPDTPTEACFPYLEGEPGAPWTPKEIRIVREKLHRGLVDAAGWMASLGTMHNVSWHDMPTSAKMLRLAFHQCMPYSDGTGGCDGCIHWDGVGARFQLESLGQFKYPKATETSNNGMSFTIEFLEEIYTNPDCPEFATSLEVSLRNCGKSRADLWTLAAIVAVEMGIEETNLACADPENDQLKQFSQCPRTTGPENCTIDYSSRPIVFTTGRSDCVQHKEKGFMSVLEDKQPDPSVNGKKTVEYMRDNFGLQARETVALMGAHTYGRKHFSHSLYRYTWTNRNEKLFTNEYFRNMVLKKEWFRKPHDAGRRCAEIGDAWGQEPQSRFLAHAFADTVDGGPVMWLQQKLVCAVDCVEVDQTSPKYSQCCLNLPAGAKCLPDNARDQTSTMPQADDDVNSGCEVFRGVSGNEESMLNSDIGLYYDFETTDGGIPYGCTNLDHFNLTMFKTAWGYRLSGNPAIAGWNAAPECALNEYAEPPGSTPLYQIVEEFAENQQLWIDNFIPAFEKMLANGYQPDELRINS